MRRFRENRVTLGIILVLTLVACGANGSDPEGLQILRAGDETGVNASYIAGTTRLYLQSIRVGQQVVATVSDGAGRMLTRIELPSDTATPSGDVRTRLEFGAADSLDGLREIAHDKRRTAELIWAYSGAMDALQAQLPPALGGPLRDALFLQPSVLSAALLHLDRSVLLDNPDLPLSERAKPGYVVALIEGAAPNDDNADSYAEPTYEVEYVDTVPEYRIRLYSGNCDGACGPGCDWCSRGVLGIHLCYTNSFCQWHDAHCGAWEHFFDCH